MNQSFTWDDLSRELLIACDAKGTIVWADGHAHRLIGAAEGQPFPALAVPGTEDKAAALLASAARQMVTGCELPILSSGRPTTVAFAGRPGPDGSVQLHGLVMPDGYGETVRLLGEAMSDVVTLNRDIARQKKELAARHAELESAYGELDESSRAVLSLHAEIADRADVMRRTSEVKGRVVANLSHELRTPLHAIIGLSRILLAETDGPLLPEQRKQVTFIQGSANQLAQLVNDLLDLAKAESGKLQIRPEPFTVTEFFSTFRGTMKPLVPTSGDVEFRVVPPSEEIRLHTDAGKIGQILRNLVSNAFKFTERGRVELSAEQRGDRVVFAVADSGIGIPPELSNESSKSSVRSRAMCSAAYRGPASVSRSRGPWPRCWAAH